MLIPYFRRKNVIALLEKHEVMTVSDIAQALDISISTARRDVNIMLEDGTIEKKRGGAFSLKTDSINSDQITPPIPDHSESAPKTLIAQKAAKTVKDGDIIFVDSGTTAGMMVQYITAKRVTVVTTGITLLQKYLPEQGISCIMLGGEFYPELSSVSGPLTEAQLSDMYFKKAYLGANAYSLERGCTYVFDMRESHIKQLVKNHSEKSYLLAETSKESKISFYKSFDLDNCTIINELTDDKDLI